MGDPQQLPNFGPLEIGLLCFGLLAFLFGIYLYWRIFAKTGNSGALSLLMLIPLVNIILLIWLAFSEWPIEKEVKELRARQGMGGQSYAPPPGPPYR